MIIFGGENKSSIMSVEIINPDNHVYISYAWRDGVEQDVLDVCQVMNDNGIQYERDKDGLCPYKANLPKETLREEFLL